MNSTLCDNCDNFMFTYIDEDKKLYNCCKRCGNSVLSEMKCVYKSSDKMLLELQSVSSLKYT